MLEHTEGGLRVSFYGLDLFLKEHPTEKGWYLINPLPDAAKMKSKRLNCWEFRKSCKGAFLTEPSETGTKTDVYVSKPVLVMYMLWAAPLRAKDVAEAFTGCKIKVKEVTGEEVELKEITSRKLARSADVTEEFMKLKKGGLLDECSSS